MMKLVPPRTIALCLLASVLIHLVGLAAVDELDDEGREQIARLQPTAERFAVERLRLPGPRDLPPAAMEQLVMEAYEAAATGVTRMISGAQPF